MKIWHLENKLFPRVIILAILALVSSHLLPGIPYVSAQTSDDWSDPINLSQSGSAGTPLLITDSDDVIHVIWQDRFDGWMVAVREGENWISSQAVGFPFQNYAPYLFSDSQGNIHALWQDDQDVLYHSKILADQFGSSAEWNVPVVVASSALAFDFQADAAGNLHLAYVRSIDANGFAAGIYFRTSLDSGNNWNQAVTISASNYFRSLSREQANVKLETTGSGDSVKLFVVWDDRPRKRVYLAQSGDGGITWEQPREIDRPNPEQGIGEPFNINITGLGSDILIVWQNGVPGSFCGQSYLFSTDSGATWSKRQTLSGDQALCSDQITFLQPVNDQIIMYLVSRNQIYLLAWDGLLWSDLRPQQSLTNFSDPITLLPISLACIQIQVIESNHLFAVGCANGEASDIWIASTILDDTSSWFPAPSSWGKPARLAIDQALISSLTLISGSEGRMHAFWMQADVPSDSSAGPSRNTIYYSDWDGIRWSNPIELLRSNINVYEYSGAFDHLGRLLIVWNDNQSGEVYFSWANESDAGNPLEWSMPLVLPISSSPISRLELSTDGTGRSSVIFSIPLNEGRGIYLTHSADLGQTWTEPMQVFDGVATDWPMIADLSSARSNDGTLHLLWERSSLPGSTGEEGLYYSRTDNSGSNWSGVYELTKATVSWSQAIEIQGSQLLLLWQEVSGGEKEIWYQISMDNGDSWGPSKSFPSFSQSQEQSLVSLTQDNAGLIHAVIQTTIDESTKEIWHWIWDGTRWLSDQHKLRLSAEDIARINDLSAAVSTSGELGVVFTGPVSEEQAELSDEVILFISHPVNESSIPLNLPALPTSEIEPTIPPEELPQEPTSTPVAIAAGSQTGQTRGLPVDRTMAGILVGVGVAGVIILVAISATMILLRKQKRREYGDQAQ